MNTTPNHRDDSIQFRAGFDLVRYANCWEDADILVQAFQGEPGKRILSIASAGDNSLALLATGADVVAADLSTPQLACLELRCAAFRQLDHDHLMAFLGVNDSDQRLRTYETLQHLLSAPARSYWNSRLPDVSEGIIHRGRFEAYFRTFRTRVLPLIHSRRTIANLLEPKDEAERLSFWNTTWNNRRWRMLLRIFFSRFLMARMGRDPEFFRYVEGSISDQIQDRARYAMTVLPPDQNPYLQYIATGNFVSALPRYLRIENYDAIRSGLNRLTLFHGPIEEAAKEHGAGGFDAFNLSDIFEYVSEETSRELYGKLLRHANVGARIAYWNTFVPRCCPSEFAANVTSQTQRSAELFAKDKAFFYGHFQVDEVRKSWNAEA
jgi:S-adenosylmethionine-diacylglycerol 3-amino-3-carboxypropyl transferase